MSTVADTPATETVEPVVVNATPIRETITIPAQLKQICDPASRRYALNAVQFTPSDNGGFLTACDGKCLAIVRCDATAKQEALIPRGVLPNAIPKSKGFLESSTYRVEQSNGRWFGEVWNSKNKPSGDGLQTAYPTEGRFPLAEDVIPAIPEEYTAVTIDPTLLAKVAKSVLSDSVHAVTLLITPNRHEIIVIGDKGAGIVMSTRNDTLDVDKSRYTEIVSGYKAARAKLTC